MDELAATRVLVVAEHADLAARVGEVLRAAAQGTEVFLEEATSLTDAARRLVGGPAPDVLLLDLDLSEMAAATAVTVLVGVPAAPPVIAIATSVTDAGRAAVAAGASDVVDRAELRQSDRLWRSIMMTIERHRRRLQFEEQGTQLVRATTQLAHLA